MKKLLAVMLSLCIILGLCTVGAFADGDEVCVIVKGTGETGDLFSSVKAAIEASEEGDTIRLLKDFFTNEPIVLQHALTLDLNGHKYSFEQVSGEEYRHILASNGNYLTIEDSSEDGTGTVKETYNGEEKALYLAYGPLVNITGGAYNGGNENEYTGSNTCISAVEGSVLNISGGSFDGMICILLMGPTYSDGYPGGTVNITGGTFKNFGWNRAGGGSLAATISGGTFNSEARNDVNEALAENCKIVDNNDGTITVRELTDDDFVASVVGADGAVKGRYIGINAANNAADAGDTIRLIKDYTMTEGDRINKKLTLDLNGFSIISESGNDQINVDDGGILTVIDSAESETSTVTAVIICTPENRDGTVQQIDFNGGKYVIKNSGYFGAEGILNFNAGSFDGNIYLRGRGYGTYCFNGGVYTNFTLKVPGPGFKVWIDSDPYDHAKFYGGVYTPLESDYDAAYEFVSGHLGEGKQIVEVVPGKTFMVGKADAEINVEPAELTLYINEETKTYQLKAEVTPKGLPVTWESSDTEVASVDENGTVTAVAVGKATVTARVTLYVDGEATVFEDTCEVTVAEKMSPPPAPDRDDGTDIKDDDTPLDEEPLPFEDVNEDDWFYEYVKEVYDEELMKGVAGDKFAPFSSTTRGMIATVIHRLEKCPEPSSEMRFADVAETWYYDAIRWGTEKEILKGYSSKKFAPKDNVTREQLIAILYRYATMKGFDTEARSELDTFEDADRVSGYAVEAMQWAVAEGIIEGSGGRLKPRDEANRAEVAAIMSRFMSYSK